MPVMLSHAVLWCLTQLSDLSVESISKNMPTTVTTCNFPQFSNYGQCLSPSFQAPMVIHSIYPGLTAIPSALSHQVTSQFLLVALNDLWLFCNYSKSFKNVSSRVLGLVASPFHSASVSPKSRWCCPFIIYQSGATCHLAQLHMRLYLCLDKQSVRPVPSM